MMKYKKQILTITFVVLFLVLGLFVYIDRNKVDKNNNPDIKFTDDKIYKSLLVTNIGTRDKDLKHVLVTIKNNSDKDFKKEYAYIHFYDENKKDIGSRGLLIPDIKKGEQVKVDIVADEKLIKAYSFTIEEK